MLLAEYVLVAIVAAAGLAVGSLTAPLLTESSAGLIGSAGTPSMTISTVGLVTAVALSSRGRCDRCSGRARRPLQHVNALADQYAHPAAPVG